MPGYESRKDMLSDVAMDIIDEAIAKGLNLKEAVKKASKETKITQKELRFIYHMNND